MKKFESGSEFFLQLTFEPLSRENWGKLVRLFNEKVACGNCWCVYYRLSKPEFREAKHDDA